MKDWQRKLRFVDLNYTFECDWLIELSDNNLADSNLASESVENTIFLNQSQSRELQLLWLVLLLLLLSRVILSSWLVDKTWLLQFSSCMK